MCQKHRIYIYCILLKLLFLIIPMEAIEYSCSIRLVPTNIQPAIEI